MNIVRLSKTSAGLLVTGIFAFSCIAGTLANGVFAQDLPAPTPEQTPPVTQKLNWKVCDELAEELPENAQECSTLKVPLDYRDPHGKTINIAVSRAKTADPQTKRGAIFLNPGGPGGPGSALPQIFAELMPKEVLKYYDLIGFDPRGVGESTPVTCGLNAYEASHAMIPLTENDSFDDTKAFMKKIAQKCAAKSGRTIPHITTANTARDMDQIRQALGLRKISYLGYSYGSYLGAVYASKFPGQTDRFILDSATNPDWLWREQFRQWRLADKDRFPDFGQYAAARDSEYHLGTTEAQVRATYLKLVQKLNKSPIELIDGSKFDGALFRAVSFGALYSDFNFPDLAYIWQAVDEITGTTSTKALQTHISALKPYVAALDVPMDNNAASALSVLCSDVAWSKAPEQYKAELKADKLIAPMFGEVGSIIGPCAYWQTGNREQPAAITDQGPRNVMIVQNMRDPSTPYIGAQGMRDQLGKRAHMVSVNEGGHAVAFIHPNTCATDAAANYFITGKLPKYDAVCDAEEYLAQETLQQSRSTGVSTKETARDLLRQIIH